MENAFFSTPVKTAVASFGMSGEIFHCPVLDVHPGFEIKSILERNSFRSKERYPYVEVVKSFEDLLNDKEIELIVVNTPNELHFPMAKSALLAGKNVVVEKPFTTNSIEGAELINLAKAQNKLLSVYQSKRYETDFLTLKKIIDQNQVGKPVELFWHMDRYRTHLTHKAWKEDDRPGAGVLYDFGVHLIDSTIQLFGLPATITCHLKLLRTGTGAPDYFDIRLVYQDLDVYLHSSTVVMDKGPNIILHGFDGSYIKQSTDPQEEQLKAGISPMATEYGKDVPEKFGFLTRIIQNEIRQEKYPSEPGNYKFFYDGIFNAIRLKKPNPVTPEQALHNIRIIECAVLSNKEGRTVNYEY